MNLCVEENNLAEQTKTGKIFCEKNISNFTISGQTKNGNVAVGEQQWGKGQQPYIEAVSRTS